MVRSDKHAKVVTVGEKPFGLSELLSVARGGTHIEISLACRPRVERARHHLESAIEHAHAAERAGKPIPLVCRTRGLLRSSDRHP